jgi:hypothetical protein
MIIDYFKIYLSHSELLICFIIYFICFSYPNFIDYFNFDWKKSCSVNLIIYIGVMSLLGLMLHMILNFALQIDSFLVFKLFFHLWQMI